MVPVRENTNEINASDVEHIGALVAGGLLLLSGMKRGGVLGTLLKVGGVGLIYRGQSGYRRLYDAIGVQLPAKPTGVGAVNETVRSEIVVQRPRQELYRIWRNFENLPVFMTDLVSVHEIDDRRSLWTARAPLGTVVKWEAEIVNEVENETIAWQSLEGSGVDNAGSVNFEDAPGGGTLVKVVLRYDPPADALGIWFSKVTKNDPKSQIDRDLAQFKQIMEIGGRAAAEKAAAGKGGKPAKPPEVTTESPAQSQPQAEVM